MSTFTDSILINASPAVVWPILADLEAWPGWTPTMLKVERLGHGPTGVGARANVLQPKLPPAVWEVTTWTPGAGFTWVSAAPGSRITADHELAPAGDGCRLTLRVSYAGPVGAIIGWLAGKLTQEYLGLECAGLKRKAEAKA